MGFNVCIVCCSDAHMARWTVRNIAMWPLKVLALRLSQVNSESVGSGSIHCKLISVYVDTNVKCSSPLAITHLPCTSFEYP